MSQHAKRGTLGCIIHRYFLHTHTHTHTHTHMHRTTEKMYCNKKTTPPPGSGQQTESSTGAESNRANRADTTGMNEKPEAFSRRATPTWFGVIDAQRHDHQSSPLLALSTPCLLAAAGDGDSHVEPAVVQIAALLLTHPRLRLAIHIGSTAAHCLRVARAAPRHPCHPSYPVVWRPRVVRLHLFT